MAKPKNHSFDLKARIEKLKEAGFTFHENNENQEQDKDDIAMEPLSRRIQFILNIIQNKPIKATKMNYLILYDIRNDKVRSYIAKYLLSKGCIRIQKSVYLAHTSHKKFDEINNTLAEINDIYENEDSIILIPLNVSDARSMKLIGQNVNIKQIIDPPNTVFF